MKGYAVYRCTRADPETRWQPLDLVRTMGEAKYMALHDAEVQGADIVAWEPLPGPGGGMDRAWRGTFGGDPDPGPGSTYVIAEIELPSPDREGGAG